MSVINFEDMLEPEESNSLVMPMSDLLVMPMSDLIGIHNDLVKAVLEIAKTCDENGAIGKRGLTRKETKKVYKLINPVLQYVQDAIFKDV